MCVQQVSGSCDPQHVRMLANSGSSYCKKDTHTVILLCDSVACSQNEVEFLEIHKWHPHFL
jgi:hypothetical protein